jgi:UDP-glucuronate 4-epimerase
MQQGERLPIFGDGQSLRDFTFVDDLVGGLVLALDRDLGFSILNFGAGRQVSVLDVVKILEHALVRKADLDWLPAQIGDVRRTWADISAAREMLGYAPTTSLEEGVGRFVEWLESAR